MHRLGYDDAPILTPRQQTVLALLATGLTSHTVAAVLRAPVDEVRADTRGAILALGAHSKLEAVVIALRDRLVRFPPGPVAVRG
jgi:DNA-binding NarL/FixJ family response regulator